MTATPNHALQRTATAVTARASSAVAELGVVRPLAPRLLNLCLPELVTVRILSPTGEPYRCADLLLRVHAVARRKNDFRLGPYPTDSDGVARITKADLESAVAATLDSGLMDYYHIEDCHSAVQISLWTPDEILRAHNARSTTWTLLLSGEQRRWHSIEELLALYSRALAATRSLDGLRPLGISAEWTDPAAKHSYDLHLQQSNVA